MIEYVEVEKCNPTEEMLKNIILTGMNMQKS
jgi:hypothetical protein